MMLGRNIGLRLFSANTTIGLLLTALVTQQVHRVQYVMKESMHVYSREGKCAPYMQVQLLRPAVRGRSFPAWVPVINIDLSLFLRVICLIFVELL